MNIEQYFAITSANEVCKITKPLTTHFNIKHFRYLKLYHDGSRIILSNYPDCTRFMYQEENYKKMWFDGEFKEKLKPGWHLWDVMRTINSGGEISSFEKEINQLLDLYHGLTYISEGANYYEIYTFDSNHPLVYQTEYKILKYFILFFKEQAKKLIKKGEHEKIVISDKRNLEKCLQPCVENNASKFMNDININRFYIENKSHATYLTTKEAECAYWIIQGKTTEEISMILGNKNRTIEAHIDNIRKKLNCSKQTQIVRILLASGFLDYEELFYKPH